MYLQLHIHTVITAFDHIYCQYMNYSSTLRDYIKEQRNLQRMAHHIRDDDDDDDGWSVCSNVPRELETVQEEHQGGSGCSVRFQPKAMSAAVLTDA